MTKVLFVIRHGQASIEFTKSLIAYVSCQKTYEIEYHVSSPGEYEQDTMRMFAEKMPASSILIFISPTTGFTHLSIDKLVSSNQNNTVYGIPVPTGLNTFSGGEVVQESGHARIMTATFQLSSIGSQIKLDKDASVEVSTFQRNDIICIPYEVAKKSPDISHGYSNLMNCRMYTEFTTSYMGISGCLLEQLRHVVTMRGLNPGASK